MTRDDQQPQVVGFDPASSEAAAASTAYPLTLPIYAATRIDMSDPAMRRDYASFIRYAVGDGQEPGEALGQLPGGYAPLPQSWREQALATASAIETGRVAAPANPPASAPPIAPPTVVNRGTNPAGPAAVAPPASAPVDVVGAAAATGPATTVLAGPPSPPDGEFGGYGAVVPVSAAAGLAAVGASLFFSRRRLV